MDGHDESAFAMLGGRGLADEMRRHLEELLTAREQTEKLLRVVVGLSSDLDLDATLDRIVTAAMELTGARYGAMSIRDADGAMVSFIHHGIAAPDVARIGDPPVGKGVLGIRLDDAPALRLPELSRHPDAVGFPPNHPPMHAFLGVPITVQGNTFGILYLTHADPERTFSESDEMSARMLASAAAVAVNNAQLFDRVRASATWMKASREITTALLSTADVPNNPMHIIAERARQLAEAEQAIVLVPEAPDPPGSKITTLVVSTAVGLYADDVVGERVAVNGWASGGKVFLSGSPLITGSFDHPVATLGGGHRPAIVMPLRSNGDTILGVLAVARHDGAVPFEPSYLEILGDFANQAAIALDLARARRRERQMSLLAERERIAHDLHDHVIQRLFAAGLDLQGSIARSTSPEVNARLTRTIDELQATIETIRSTIFELQSPSNAASDFRQRLEKVVADLTEDRDIATGMHFAGPLSAVGDSIADHAEAVTTEAVSNAVRHSGASRLDIAVTVGDTFELAVSDDGRGIPAENRRASGLANMRRRAELLGGSCAVGPGSSGGTRIRWTVPLVPD